MAVGFDQAASRGFQEEIVREMKSKMDTFNQIWDELDMCSLKLELMLVSVLRVVPRPSTLPVVSNPPGCCLVLVNIELHSAHQGLSVPT